MRRNEFEHGDDREEEDRIDPSWVVDPRFGDDHEDADLVEDQQEIERHCRQKLEREILLDELDSPLGDRESEDDRLKDGHRPWVQFGNFAEWL